MALAIVCIESMVFFVVFLSLLGAGEAPDGHVEGPVAAFLLSACCVGAFYYTRLYDFIAVGTFHQFLRRVPQSALAAAVVVGSLAYVLLPASTLSWTDAAYGLLVIVGILMVSRALWYQVLARRPFVENVLVLGHTTLAQALVAEMDGRRRYRVLQAPRSVGKPGRIAKDGTAATAPLDLRQLTAVPPHRIVVALSERRGRVPMAALLEAKRLGIAIEDGLHLYERLTGKLNLNWLQPSHIVFSPHFCPSAVQCAWQRTVSVMLASVGLVLCAPVIGLVAALVKLDSPGPVFFVQERIGRNGLRFRLIKFRTMHPAEARTSEWARDNGDRITRVGRWLRQFRLDELPQLWNVLRGDMNLVGPRPHPASNYDLFVSHIPYYAFRSLVRPGITGWAQVRYGYANNLDEETEKMRYDLYYIKHLSVWMDLRIMLMTIKVVLLGQQTLLAGKQAVLPEPRAVNRFDAA